MFLHLPSILGSETRNAAKDPVLVSLLFVMAFETESFMWGNLVGLWTLFRFFEISILFSSMFLPKQQSITMYMGLTIHKMIVSFKKKKVNCLIQTQIIFVREINICDEKLECSYISSML